VHTKTHPLVERYLSEFAEALGALSPERRSEFVREISSHIQEALAGATVPLADEEVEALLTRLGDPKRPGASLATEAAFNEKAEGPVWRRSVRGSRSLRVVGLISLTLVGLTSLIGAILKPLVGPDVHLYHFGFALPPAVEVSAGIGLGVAFLWVSWQGYRKIGVRHMPKTL
jgi:uncharacterized membrane protein